MTVSGCLTPGAPRGRFVQPGTLSVGGGYHFDAAPVTVAVPTPDGQGRTVKGDAATTRAFGGEMGFILGAFPSVGVARYQLVRSCDLGLDLNWWLLGGDVRCALPGTRDWLGLSLGGRVASMVLGDGGDRRLPYELRAAVDLVKPTDAAWAPIFNLGASWGRQRYFADADFPPSVAPGSMEAREYNLSGYFVEARRSEARAEGVLGLESPTHAPRWWRFALVGNYVLWHGDLAQSVGCGAQCNEVTSVRHAFALGITVMIGTAN